MKTRTFLNRISTLTLSIPLLITLGCTDAPKQYKAGTYQEPDWVNTSIPANPESSTFSKKEDDTQQAENQYSRDELSDIWSKAEIVYGSGLKAYINGEVFGELKFSTTLDEGSKLLPKQNWGPIKVEKIDSSGLTAFYPAGFLIIWRAEEPKTIDWILFINQFQGEMRIKDFGTLKMGRSLNSPENGFKIECKKDKREFFRQLYNALEGKPNTFSCFDSKLCSFKDQSDGSIGFNSSQLNIFFTKDAENNIPYQIHLKNEVPQGKLDTFFDLTKGAFLIDKDVSAANILLGDSNGSVSEKLEIKNDKNDVKINEIGNEYSGIYLGYEKLKYDRSIKAPLPDSRLKTIALWGSYTQPILLNGKLIRVDSSDDNLSLRLSDESETIEGVKYLGIKNEIPGVSHKSFVGQFAELIKGNLPDVLFVQHTGHNKLYVAHNSYNSLIVSYDKKSQVGKYIQFSFDIENGDFYAVEIGLLSDPIDRVIVPNLNRAINSVDKTLGGFTLGEKIHLTNIDVGREEATLIYSAENNSEQKTRVSFKEGILTRFLGAGLTENIPVHILEVGTLTVKLGVKAGKVEDSNGQKTMEAEIVSISTDNHGPGVQNICGLADFSAKTGDSYRVVKARLDKAIAEKKKGLKALLELEIALREKLKQYFAVIMPKVVRRVFASASNASVKQKRDDYENYNCKYVLVKSDADSLEMEALVFPELGLRFSFSNNELGSIQIYSLTQKEVQ